MVEVSVIITNYNYGKYLGRCVRSCLNQSLPKSEYEIIIVDDGSTDNSKKVIELFGEEVRPIFIKHSGVAYASNIGIKEARGMYVIRVDADDYINRNTLLFMSEILNWNPEIGFVYCDLLKVDQYGRVIESIKRDTVEKLYNHGAGIMFRKSNLEAIGLYDVTLENCEDYDLLIRYFKNFDGYYLRVPLYRYFWHENNLTANKKAREKWRKKVIKKHEKRYLS